MSSLKPICVACHRFYRVKKNGVWFLEGMPRDNCTAPGLAEPQNWKPYKLWRGDLWECHGCGHELIAGVGREPVREHFEEDFQSVVNYVQPFLQVNDC